MAEIIKLTPEAQAKVKELRSEEDSTKEAFRVAVTGQTCGGYQYKLGWDNPTTADMIHRYDEDLMVVVGEESVMPLVGATLEYHDSEEKQGFEIIHPSPPKSGCKCSKGSCG